MDEIVTVGMMNAAIDRAVEKLAIMIKAGFDATAKAVDLMTLDERVQRIEKRLHSLEQRMDILEREVAAIRADMHRAESDEVALAARVCAVEKAAGLR